MDRLTCESVGSVLNNDLTFGRQPGCVNLGVVVTLCIGQAKALVTRVKLAVTIGVIENLRAGHITINDTTFKNLISARKFVGDTSQGNGSNLIDSGIAAINELVAHLNDILIAGRQ